MGRLSIAVTLAAAAVLVPVSASAATVPDAPTGCTTTAQDATHVALAWTAPANNGGAALKWYAYQRQGDTGTLHTPDGSTTTAVWTGTYTTADTFRVRAVNSVGFSVWDVCDWGSAPPPPPPADPRPFIAYTAGAWLKQTTDALTVNASKTSAMRSYITTHDPNTAPKLGGVDGNQWGEVYDMADCSDPVWKIGTGTVPASVAFLKTTGFHADAAFGSWLTGTTDSPFVVIDRCSGMTVWGGAASHGTGNVINVGAAGAFMHDSNGLDRRVPGSDSTVNERSRGVIPDSMVIRKDQLDYAIANGTDLGQRLEIFWWETDSSAGKISPPMAGYESGQSGWGAEGQLIGVDPSLDLSTRSCTPAALAIAKTLQHYGAYIGDNAGKGGTTLKVEQDHGQWASEPLSQNELGGCITWNDLVAYN